MNRYGYTLLAATALTLSMGSIASADNHGDEAEKPEDAATAPMEATDGGSTDTEATGEMAEGGDAKMETSDAEVDPDAVMADPNIVVSYEDGGRYYTEDDVPTFNVAEDGSVDWLTFSGFRRYHSECHVCHGPDGEGSTYAPAIKNSAVNMDYYDFYDTVVNGRKNGNSVMPHFGDNQNVMCYLDDIYVYLKARGAGVVERGRPAKKEAKSDMIQEAENACMG